MNLKDFVGNLLGQMITDWDQTFDELKPTGGVDNKTLIAIVVELCKRVEALEAKL